MNGESGVFVSGHDSSEFFGTTSYENSLTDLCYFCASVFASSLPQQLCQPSQVGFLAERLPENPRIQGCRVACSRHGPSGIALSISHLRQERLANDARLTQRQLGYALSHSEYGGVVPSESRDDAWRSNPVLLASSISRERSSRSSCRFPSSWCSCAETIAIRSIK